MSPISLLSIEELILKTYKKNENQIYLLLDGITDTRNFGSIIRTSVAGDVAGIIISQNNSAPINSDVIMVENSQLDYYDRKDIIIPSTEYIKEILNMVDLQKKFFDEVYCTLTH